MAPDLESRRLNGGIRIRGLRVLAFAAWFALACETQTSPVLTGTLVLNVSSEAAIAGVNSWLVTVTGPSGSTSKSGAPGSTVEFSDLAPGQYVVRLQGSGGPGLVAEGQTNANVSAGEVTVATVPVVMLAVSVVVAPSTVIAVVGFAMEFSASARDVNNNVVTGRPVLWSSSDQSKVTVSSTGLVTAVAPGGPVTITATIDGRSGTAAVTVILPPVATVTVTPPSSTIQPGGTAQLTATLRDATGNVLTGRTVAWSSSNAAIATVNPSTGLVTGVASGGPVTITATSEGRSGSAQVTVIPVPVATVTVAPPTSTIQTGGTAQLTATLRDATGNVLTGRTVTWSSSNSAIATVNSTGLVTGIAAGGPVTITATVASQSDKFGTAAVTVVSSCPSPSQSPFPLSVSGVLGSGDCTFTNGTWRDAFSVTYPSGSGKVIGLSATASAFVPLPHYYDPISDTYINHGQALRLVTGQSTAILAIGQATQATGSYTFAASLTAQDVTGCQSTNTHIQSGTTTTQNLAATDCAASRPVGPSTVNLYADTYWIGVAAGATLSVQMSSTSFDTYLRVFNDVGMVVAENDDVPQPGNTNSSLAFVNGAQFRFLRIEASSFTSLTQGQYVLAVNVTLPYSSLNRPKSSPASHAPRISPP